MRRALLICILLLSSIIVEAKLFRAEADSLENLLNKRIEKGLYDDISLSILNRLIELNTHIDISKSTEFIELAKKIAPRVSDKNLVQYSFNRIATLYYYRGVLDSALIYYQQSMLLNKEIGDIKGFAFNHTDIAYVYYTLELNDLAEDMYLKAIELARKDNGSYELGHAFVSISMVYRKKLDYKKSLEAIFQARHIFQAINYTYGMIQAETYLGLAYLESANYISALEHLRASKVLAERYRHPFMHAYISSYFGLVYAKMDSMYLSNRYYHESIDSFTKLGFVRDIANINTLLARNRIKMMDYQGAEDLLLKAIDDAKQFEAVPELQEAYELISQLYFKTGRYKDAFYYSQLEEGINTAIYSKRLTSIISNFRIESETRDKTELIELLQSHNSLQENYIRRGYMMIILIISLLLATIFFLVIFINRTRAKERLNKEVILQRKELEDANALLQKHKGELEALVRTREKFISIIAHDLRNPMHAIISLTEMLSKAETSMSENEIQELHISLNIAANQSFKLLDNLLDWSRLQTGSVTPKPEKLRLYDEVAQIIMLNASHAASKKISVENHVSYTMNLMADRNMIRTILRNLLSNAIKFSRQGNSIQIYSIETEEALSLVVKDFGSGINSQHLSELTMMKTGLSQTGTSGEKGSGIGLKLVFEFMKLMNGELTIESETGIGSSFFCTFKK